MSLQGLPQSEAQRRLAADGYNDLPSPERHSGFAIAADVMREPMFMLLLGAALLYTALGDLGEALVLAGFATVSVSIAVVQRGRSERVLDALRDLTSPRALVIRDGEARRIPGREVVRGDLLLLTEGDRVPADATLVEGSDIRADESLLTGESVPVRKRCTADLTRQALPPGGDDSPFVFSGTLILGGTGRAIVTATGAHSEIGKIGRAVTSIEQEQPRLQAQTRQMVAVFASGALVLSTFAVILYGMLRGDWAEAFLGGIALGMAMLPEEFPLVLTVFTVMGAWRLSRSRVLTRRAAAIETLGAATVLCTDKTGTLTRNAMSVAHLEMGQACWSEGQPANALARSAALSALLRVAERASDEAALDPMERAIHELAARVRGGAGTADSLPAFAPAAATSAVSSGVLPDVSLEMPPDGLVRTYPLRPELLAVTQVWRRDGAGSYEVAAKGAPEVIARLCQLGPAERLALTTAVDRLAREGMRVLAVASGVHAGPDLPQFATGFELRFMGLIGLADPLRVSVPAAVRECRSAGIRVVMITGDYPETALAIARQAGIEDGALLTGQDLNELSDAALARRVRTVTVFARITPSQKLRIVTALKTAGEVVAMTGDGVNDAPALKAAHIGIAMGGRGTDVAREAAALVLLDDDFGSIVQAVRLGRRMYDNLRKAIGYILAIHIPIAGLALLPIVMGWPLLLTPVLIAFLELVIDPACSIVLEAEREEQDIMRRPPRDTRSPLLSRSLALWGILQGALALAAVAGLYVFAIRRGLPQDEVRAVAFVALVAANLALIFVGRTFAASLSAALVRPNASLGWGLAIVAVLLATIFGWPAARSFFGLAVLQGTDVVLCLAVALALLWMLQWLKKPWQRDLYT